MSNRYLANTATLEKMILLPDEPCWRLVEMNLPPPDNHAQHRYQLVQVLRNDRLVYVRIDMGLASDWDTETFSILALGQCSVAKAQEIADEKRADHYWRKFHRELQEEADETFLSEIATEEEEMNRIRRNFSIFGPGGHTQRNGLDRRLLHRSYQ